jgi:hypothetical protein
MIDFAFQTSWWVLVRMRQCQELFPARQLSICLVSLVSCTIDSNVKLCILGSLGCLLLPSESPSATTIPHKILFKLNMLDYTELNPWSRALFEMQTCIQSDKKFPAFDGTWVFITVLTKALSRPLSAVRWIQSTPVSYFSKIHFNIILPSTPRPSSCSLQVFYQNLYEFLLCPVRATSPTYLIIVFGEQYKLCSSLDPLISSLFGPDILLSTLF